MRKTFTLTLAFILAGGLVRAGQLANGMTFQAPAGWTVKSNEKASILLPPDLVSESNEPSEL